jgi:AraC family transcriptional regulator
MEHWQKVCAAAHMQEYIAAHITEPITLADLVRSAGYSPWHAARIFREITGRTPFDYIRALRLSKAAERLRGGSERVVDVAFDFVFGSHEGFTRAFTRQFGVSARRFAREQTPFQPFKPHRAHDYYLEKQKGEGKMANLNTVFVQVVERPQRRLILKRGKKAVHYFEYCEEVGCDVWETLSGIREALYEPIGMWLPENMVTPGTSVYAQGVEVPADYAGPVPAGYEIIDLPPCKMMVFQGPPYDDEKFESVIGDLWELMKTCDPTLYGFEWADEDGPRFQLAPMGYRGYIEARPVRALRDNARG